MNRLDVITPRDEITVTYEAGTVEDVTQHDGTVLRLRKLAKDYDVHDPIAAMRYLLERHSAGEIVTGLLYVERGPEDLHKHLHTPAAPLKDLGEAELCPGSATLASVNASLR